MPSIHKLSNVADTGGSCCQRGEWYSCSCQAQTCLLAALQGKQRCHACRKGWSATAAECIKQGSFVCLYAGELLTSAEAAARLTAYDARPAHEAGHALMVGVSGTAAVCQARTSAFTSGLGLVVIRICMCASTVSLNV